MFFISQSQHFHDYEAKVDYFSSETTEAQASHPHGPTQKATFPVYLLLPELSHWIKKQ